MRARAFPFFLLAIVACGGDSTRAASPTPAREPPTAEITGANVLVWVDEESGAPFTYRLREGGVVVERSPGVQIVTTAGEWTWIAKPVPVSTAACTEGSVTRPAGVGAATRVVLASEGREQLVVAHDAPCCPNEARHTVRLRASLGPMLFVEESDFSFHCGAHGSTEVSFFVWDAERGRRIDVLADLPDAERLRAAATPSTRTSFAADETSAQITALVPVFRERDVAFEAQLSSPACYACGDGIGSSYTRSIRLPAAPPSVLAPWISLPSSVAAFRRSHPHFDVRGFSRIPQGKP